MHASSLITLRKEALRNNVHFLKNEMGSRVRISSVVKANAYGHGIEKIVPLFEEAGFDHFSVFDFGEAVRVQDNLKKAKDIMIMGWIADECLRETIRRGIEFYIFSLDRLKRALEAARELGIRAKIHLEAETGMNRSGLAVGELKQAISIIKSTPECFHVKGFCTHLSGAENISNLMRIQRQLERYHEYLSILAQAGIDPEYRHVANSAAAFVYPKARLNMVRIGIMQYGFWSNPETFYRCNGNRKDPLQRILDWKSRIMSVKTVKAGEFIGYGVSFRPRSEMRIALVPVGYSLGYSRSLSNRGKVLIHNQKCNVIGLVNMNMFMVNITALPDAKLGDEVVLIGHQGKNEIKVSAFGDSSERLNYEVLAHLPHSIERIVI